MQERSCGISPINMQASYFIRLIEIFFSSNDKFQIIFFIIFSIVAKSIVKNVL